MSEPESTAIMLIILSIQRDSVKEQVPFTSSQLTKMDKLEEEQEEETGGTTINQIF